MSVSAAITSKLAASTALIALIGQRFFPLQKPEGIEGDHVIWQQVAADPDSTHRETASVTHHLIQFSCFAGRYDTAISIREAVIAALENQALSTGDIPNLEDLREGYEDTAKLYRADVDFLI